MQHCQHGAGFDALLLQGGPASSLVHIQGFLAEPDGVTGAH